jgi:hypothetical protein
MLTFGSALNNEKTFITKFSIDEIKSRKYYGNSYHYYSSISINKSNESEKWYDDENNERVALVMNFYKLFETILYISKDTNMYIDKLVDLIIKHIKPNWIKQIVEKIINNLEKYPPSIKKLIEFRKKYIENIITTQPRKFSWCMPDANTSDKSLLEFLQSDKMTIIDKRFTGIAEGRSFVSRFTGFKNGYSITMEANGSGKNTQVSIQKTKHQFNKESAKLKELKKELDKIKQIL